MDSSNTTTRNTSILITKDGVSVGGHVLHGVIGYNVRHDPARGVFEVGLRLVTTRCQMDLGDGVGLVGSYVVASGVGSYAAGSAAPGAADYNAPVEQPR